jgi:hypothetical protein
MVAREGLWPSPWPAEGGNRRRSHAEGLWPSPWPAEGGNRRRSHAPSEVAGLGIGPGGRLTAAVRDGLWRAGLRLASAAAIS